MSKRVLPGNNHSFSSNSMSTRNVKQTPSAKHPYQRPRYSNGRNTNENTNTNNSSNKRGNVNNNGRYANANATNVTTTATAKTERKHHAVTNPYAKKMKPSQHRHNHPKQSPKIAPYYHGSPGINSPAKSGSNNHHAKYARMTKHTTKHHHQHHHAAPAINSPSKSESIPHYGNNTEVEDQFDFVINDDVINILYEGMELFQEDHPRSHTPSSAKLAATTTTTVAPPSDSVTFGSNNITDSSRSSCDTVVVDRSRDAVIPHPVTSGGIRNVDEPDQPILFDETHQRSSATAKAKKEHDNSTKKRKSKGKGKPKETKKKKAKVDTIHSKFPNNNTLTQCGGGFFDENAERHPLLDNQITYHNRTYIKGDVFQRLYDEKKHDDILNYALVTIEGFETDCGIKYATLKAEYYIQLEDTYIGTEEATVVGNGLYVKRISSSPMKTRLLLLGERRNTAMDPIHFKYIYTGKQGKGICCYKSINTNSKVSKPIIRGPNGEIPFGNLYAGGGGVDIGYQEAGFHGTFSVDSDTASCSTLQTNFPDSVVYQYTVKDFLKGCGDNPNSSAYPKIGSIMLLHGSTPCQGFSSANRNTGFDDEANNQETKQFMDVVKYFSPPFVTFENVEGIKREDNKVYLQKMISLFLSLDYQVRACTLNAADYGDPQIRKRVIIFAAKDGLELPEVPSPTHGKSRHLLPYRTAGDTLGFLENINPLKYNGLIETTFNGSTIAMEGHVQNNAKWDEDDKPLTKNNPVPTILKKRVIVHYDTEKNRLLTRLERSMLQSFPPTYKFRGNNTEIHDQIGNAVPVCLARAIGRSVIDAIRHSNVSH